jgi:tetratricopeptide (TPR) repeat protein/CHAT domain-containing protein
MTIFPICAPFRVFAIFASFFVFTPLCGLTLAEAVDSSSPGALLKDGQKLLNQGRLTTAFEAFEKMRRSCGGDRYCEGVATFYIARTYLDMAQYDRALESLQGAEDAFAELGKTNERAKVFHVRARVYSERSEFSEALRWFGLSEQMLGSGGSKDVPELFQLWMNRAKVYIYLSKFDSAAKDLERAEQVMGSKLSKGQKAMLAQRRGWILAEQQSFPDAEKYYRTALQLFEEINNKKETASVLNNLAHIDETKANYDRALKEYGEALKLSKEFAGPAEQAFIFNNMGNVQRKRGNYDEAVRLYNEALRIRKKQAIKQFYAETLNNLGIVYLAYGDYGKASGYFRECHEVSKETESKSGQAWALHNMAWVYKDQGFLMKSQQCSDEAVALAKEINNRRLLATAILRLGNLAEYYGNFDAAIKHYKRAAKIQSDIGDRFFLSNTYFDWGTGLTRRGEELLAHEKFSQAITLKDEIGAPKGEALCKFALFYLEKDRYAKGKREESRDSREEIARAGARLKEADAAIKPEEKNDRMLLDYAWGRLLLEQDPQGAVRRFEELRTLAALVGSLKYAFLASTGLGLAYEKMKDWPKAESEYERALGDAEKIRETLDPYLKKTFLHGEEVLGMKHVIPYQGLARVRMLRGDKVGSLKAAEFTKARSFADKLAQRIGGASFGVDTKLSDQLTRTEIDLRATYKRLEECRGQGGDQSLVGKLEDRRQSLGDRYEKIKLEIRRKYPDFYAVRFPEPTPIERSALKENEFVLAYEVTDTGVLVYLTKGKKVIQGFFQPIAKRDLDALVRAYREPLEHIKEWRDLGKFDLKAGEELFDLLIKDVRRDLPSHEAVIVVTDGALSVLPFEMLPTNKGGRIDADREIPAPVKVDFLADNHLISYWQSITALTLARNRAKSSASAGKMLVVANPVTGTAEEVPSSPKKVKAERKKEIDRLMRGESSPDQADGSRSVELKLLSPNTFKKLSDAFGPLEETQPLADACKERFGAGKVDVFTGKDATIEVFRQKVAPHMPSYSNVLFATHGYFGEALLPEVDEPILVLSMIPPLADNLLRMSEVMELDMNADIVTLLACQSGLGEMIFGEGTMGMGRAFQYAGAKSVLMSLWSVDAKASVQLAEVFLRGIAEGKSKLEALQMARKEVRKQGFDHPFFWASFILVGEIN